jgi:hypothetical protein
MLTSTLIKLRGGQQLVREFGNTKSQPTFPQRMYICRRHGVKKFIFTNSDPDAFIIDIKL